MNTQSINKKMRRLAIVSAFLGLGLLTNTASALVRVSDNTVEQNFGAAANLDLDDTVAGVQSRIAFQTVNPNTFVRVIFNAEGSIAGGPLNWLDSTIFIDPFGTVGPVACSPSNSDNAFVSGNHTATQNDGWVSAVTQCWYKIPTAGVHTVRVLMTPHPANAAWRIDDLSIVIDSE